MFDTGNNSSRVRRLLRAAMPVTPPPPNRRSSLALRLSRPSPFLLLAAALVALAVLFFAPGAQPAQAQTTTTEYWSTTLSVKTVDYGFGCGYRTGQPNCSAALVDQAVVYHGKLYTVVLVHVAYGDTLQLILDNDPVDSDGTRTERARMALNVGTGALSKQFLVKDAMVSYGIAQNSGWTNEDAWVLTWHNSGLSWSEGDSVSLSLVTLPVGGL